VSEPEWLVVQLPSPGFPVTPTDANTTYIGDAVYATQGRYAGELILWTDREEGRHHMSIEPRALQALVDYARKQGWKVE
jgi:hypothetical protein